MTIIPYHKIIKDSPYVNEKYGFPKFKCPRCNGLLALTKCEKTQQRTDWAIRDLMHHRFYDHGIITIGEKALKYHMSNDKYTDIEEELENDDKINSWSYNDKNEKLTVKWYDRQVKRGFTDDYEWFFKPELFVPTNQPDLFDSSELKNTDLLLPQTNFIKSNKLAENILDKIDKTER